MSSVNLSNLSILNAAPLQEAAAGDVCDECDAVRERTYEKLGEIDREMLVGKQSPVSFYIIHRSNRNIAIASRGLAKHGLEILAEADEKEVGSSPAQLVDSFMYRMMDRVAKKVLPIASRIRKGLDVLGMFTMWLEKLDVPNLYVSPKSDASWVLIGIRADEKVPEFIQMPHGERVRLVTVRLLTIRESEELRKTDELLPAISLEKYFRKEGTYHVSTTRNSPAKAVQASPLDEYDEACQRTYERLGEVDGLFDLPTYSMYIVRRGNGNVALGTSGLARRCGVELIAEAEEKEVGSGAALSTSFLFQMMHVVAERMLRLGLKIRQSLDENSPTSIAFENVDFPDQYVCPNTNRTQALLGMKADDISNYSVPEHINIPQRRKVKLVTVRLLTYEEGWQINAFGNQAHKALEEYFRKEGSYHVSTIRGPDAPADPPGFVPKLILAGPAIGEPASYISEEDRKMVAAYPFVPFDTAVTRLTELLERNNELHRNFDTRGFDPKQSIARMSPRQSMYRSPLTRFRFNVLAPATPLRYALNIFERYLRAFAASPASETQDFAKQCTNYLWTQTRLDGWFQFEAYNRDPKDYHEHNKTGTPFEPYYTLAVGTPGQRRFTVRDLQETCSVLTGRFIQLVEWISGLQHHAGEPFDPGLCMTVIAANKRWTDDTAILMREADGSMRALFVGNQKQYHEFQRLRGCWPHSQALLNEIEASGFKNYPTMMKLDRSHCNICDVEVVGWRPWHDPWNMHNASRHPPGTLWPNEKVRNAVLDKMGRENANLINALETARELTGFQSELNLVTWSYLFDRGEFFKHIQKNDPVLWAEFNRLYERGVNA